MTEQEFFEYEMDAARTRAIQKCLEQARSANDPDTRRAIEQMAESFKPLSECRYGFLGSAQMYCMAEALLSVRMTDWERFYHGYVKWAMAQPETHFPTLTIAEENARGAMLMAVADRCKELNNRESRYKEALTKSG